MEQFYEPGKHTQENIPSRPSGAGASDTYKKTSLNNPRAAPSGPAGEFSAQSLREDILHTEQLSIRCPHCFQVFTAFQKEFEEEYPDFQCSVCYGQFWINPQAGGASSAPKSQWETDILGGGVPRAFSGAGTQSLGAGASFGGRGETRREVILGSPISVPKPEPVRARLGSSLKMCPKCSEEVPIEEPVCPFCSVVFINIIEGVESSFHLRGLWAKTLKHWHSDAMHDEFLQSCRKNRDLTYCVSCYGRILKEDKSNKKAIEMIKRIEALTWFFEEETNKKTFHLLPFFKNMNKSFKKAVAAPVFDALMLTILVSIFFFLFF